MKTIFQETCELLPENLDSIADRIEVLLRDTYKITPKEAIRIKFSTEER